MLLLGQAPGGALSARRCTTASPLAPFPKPNVPLFSKKSKTSFANSNPRTPPHLAAATAGDGPSSPSRPSSFPSDDALIVRGDDDVPLEGVIQLEKTSSASSQVAKWGKVAFLAGGDVLFLLLFSAIGRFSHGFPVLDFETIRTADPFLAGWFLSAYFLGGYSEDGRGENGSTKATLAAAKSWVVGIPDIKMMRMTSGGYERDNLYYMDFSTTFAGATSISTDPNLWHRLLGHPSTSKLSIMFPNLPQIQPFQCETCQMGKHHRFSYPHRMEDQRSSPFDLIHCDVRDPCCVTTVSGHRYFIIFIDDYSHLS